MATRVDTNTRHELRTGLEFGEPFEVVLQRIRDVLHEPAVPGIDDTWLYVTIARAMAVTLPAEILEEALRQAYTRALQLRSSAAAGGPQS